MKVKIMSYGICRDIVKADHLELNEDQITVSGFRKSLFEQYPSLVQLNSLAIATDDEYREDDFIILDGTEVVLIPPVSGG